MRKLALATMIIFVFMIGIVYTQETNADQAYIKAMTAKDVNQKAQLLKDYLNVYSGQSSTYENFANAHLCLLPFNGKTQQDTITYGEKAISLGGLDGFTECQILIHLSTNLTQLNQSLSKAKSYGQRIIEIAEANKGLESEPANIQKWNQLIGAGYYTQAEAMKKAEDYKGAVGAYVQSYDVLKNPQIIDGLTQLGKTLYDRKDFKNAELAFKVSAEVKKDFGSLYYYGKTLYRNGKKEHSLSQFKQAYTKQKNGDVAFNIGIILAGQVKKNPASADEAIDFLLEASFLSKANTKKAMDMAQDLFFNTVHKDLGYNNLVQEIGETVERVNVLTDEFNQLYGEKSEEDLTRQEKNAMDTLLSKIEMERKNLEELEMESQAVLEKFNQEIALAKKRLGIN